MRVALVALLGMAVGCGLSTSGESTGGVIDAGADAGNVPPPFDAGGPDAPVVVDSGVDAPFDAGFDAPFDAGVDAPTYLAGYALKYDGNASYVDMGGGLGLSLTTFTLEAWVYPLGYNGETYIAAQDKRAQAQGQFRFGMTPSGQLFFAMSDGSGNSFGLFNGGESFGLISPAAIPTGTWSEVAVTKNDRAYALFLNGANVANFTASGSFVFNDGGNPNPFRVGARVDNPGPGPDGVFDGTIDEVRFWSTARSASQISADLRHELDATDPNWTDLVNYWRFDEGAGPTTNAQVGGKTGTLVSAPAWVLSTAF